MTPNGCFKEQYDRPPVIHGGPCDIHAQDLFTKYIVYQSVRSASGEIFVRYTEEHFPLLLGREVRFKM